MELFQRTLVTLAWDRALTTMEATRATRKRSVLERKAWFRWRRRWQELEHEDPGDRKLVVCATCARYRDGRGHWVPMPDGLNEVLASARSICVSHGLCPACSTRALHALKVLPPSDPAATVAARGWRQDDMIRSSPIQRGRTRHCREGPLAP
jgi:hypothetical protein